MHASDFPHCFQHLIIYHNIEKFAEKRSHNYLWENREETFLFNEARVLVTVSEKAAPPAEAEEAAEESKGPNESSRLSVNPPESAE